MIRGDKMNDEFDMVDFLAFWLLVVPYWVCCILGAAVGGRNERANEDRKADHQ